MYHMSQAYEPDDNVLIRPKEFGTHKMVYMHALWVTPCSRTMTTGQPVPGDTDARADGHAHGTTVTS